MVIFETPDVRITYHLHFNCLIIKWLRNPCDTSFVSTHLAALQFSIDSHRVKLYCTDLTLIGSLSREQEAWLSQECYKKSYNVLQDEFYVAVVFSEQHFKAVVSNYVVPSAMPSHEFVHINYFTDQGEALQWLESIKKGQDAALIRANPDLCI